MITYCMIWQGTRTSASMKKMGAYGVNDLVIAYVRYRGLDQITGSMVFKYCNLHV